ncbi:unnamed protein product [Vicia faba]|uniref:Nodule-specific Glycine Rich Peptide n=1 Tax=Vicia faba TaxID=3906 RepID=A0AAV0ZK58_VICFA|nr:unnamed protein product [Vicia faba]
MKPFKDGKQFGVIEESKTIIGINKYEYWGKGRKYGDGYWGSWTEGGWAGGLPERKEMNEPGGESEGENKGRSKEEKGEPIGRDGVGHEGSWGGRENKEAHS